MYPSPYLVPVHIYITSKYFEVYYMYNNCTAIDTCCKDDTLKYVFAILYILRTTITPYQPSILYMKKHEAATS